MASNDLLVFFVVSCMVMMVHSASLETAAPIEITTVPPIVTVKPGCVWDGQSYPEGPEFRPDACTFCHCFQGRPMCAVADCFIPPCVDPVRDPNQCCPTCPNGKWRAGFEPVLSDLFQRCSVLTWVIRQIDLRAL